MKYQEVYLEAYHDGKDARLGIGSYFRFYNIERPHQTLGCLTPSEAFTSSLGQPVSMDMVESFAPTALGRAGPNSSETHTPS